MSYKLRTVSIEHLNWLNLIFSTDLKAHSKLIAAYLSTYMSSRNHCAWPSVTRIATECSMCRRAVFNHIDLLEAAGWVRKKSGGFVESKNITTRYTMSFPADYIGASIGGGGASGALGVVHEVHGGGASGAPESIKDNQQRKDICSFDDFWTHWPVKVGKTGALKAWTKLKPSQAIYDAIIANLQAHEDAGDWVARKKEGIVLHPGTYLNNKRWEDEVVSSQPKREKRVCL